MIKPPHSHASSLRALGDVDRAFDGAFSLVAFVMNRFIIDHLLRSGRRLTGNDFEALVIWGVLAHQNVAHLMPPGSLPTAILTEKGRLAGAAEGMRPLRLRDIAQITGIPRETARRKLERLAAERYVERRPEKKNATTAPTATTPSARTCTSMRRYLRYPFRHPDVAKPWQRSGGLVDSRPEVEPTEIGEARCVMARTPQS